MKTKSIGIYTRILSFFLVFLGFSACDKSGSGHNDDPIAEYGCPSAKFKVVGTIIDKETNKTIPNIQTILAARYNDNDSLYELGYGDTTYSDKSGKFELELQTFPESQEFLLKLSDIDGETNGTYDDKNIVVEFKNPSFTNGNEHWYSGETSKDLGDIEL